MTSYDGSDTPRSWMAVLGIPMALQGFMLAVYDIMDIGVGLAQTASAGERAAGIGTAFGAAEMSVMVIGGGHPLINRSL